MRWSILGWVMAAGLASCSDDVGPDPLDAGRCREAGDCAAQEQCLRPDAVTACAGADCPTDACSGDADCQTAGNSDVCRAIGGVRMCVAACDAVGCADHEACGEDGRCEPKRCAIDEDCPTNFACPGDICVRVVCDQDAPCSGFCVRGECYAEAGTCELPTS